MNQPLDEKLKHKYKVRFKGLISVVQLIFKLAQVPYQEPIRAFQYKL